MPALTLLHTFRDPAVAAAAAIAHKLRATMMPAKKLKAFVPTLDDVDEKWRELYVEETGPDNKTRFRLDADGVEDVTTLKSSLTAARRERDEAKRKAKPLEDLTEEEDVEEVISAGRASLEAKRTGKATPEVEQVRTQLTTKHNKELATLKAENTGLMDALKTAVYDGVVAVEIKDAGGREKLLKPHIKEQIEIVRIAEGDKVRYEPRVFETANGSRAERTGGDGKPFAIKALVAEMRENDDFADAFDSSVTPGTGSTPADGGGMPTPPKKGGERERPAPAPTAKDAKRATQDYQL